MGSAGRTLRLAWRGWQEDNAPQLAAALAFYSLLSIAPLVVIAMAIAGALFGDEAARMQLVGQFRQMVGSDGAKAVEDILANSSHPETSLAASLAGVATLLVGAAGVFGQLQDSLNQIWNVESQKAGGIFRYIQKRFLSFAMVLGTGFLLMVSLVFSTMIAAVSSRVGDLFPGLTAGMFAANALVSFVLGCVVFALIFRNLPDANVPWRHAWVGSLLTSALFVLGKFLIGQYLSQAAPGSTYGAAGSLVVFVLWVYYSAHILFIGAEITEAMSHKGSGREEGPIRR